MESRWIVAGAALGFVGVSLGAFGAHALSGRLDERSLDLWRTGVLYQLLHAAPVTLLGLVPGRRTGRELAGWAFLAGVVVFSGSLYGLALGAPRWLGAVTPLGGVLLLSGWILLAVSARRDPPNGS
jgi:uncharacterized membrane protein YgdD (TMEM256/DUF423 family)